MSTIDVRHHDDLEQLCERVRYRRPRHRADAVLEELGATDASRAVRRSEVGIIDGPVFWWLRARGVVVERSSGRIWLNADRRDALRAGMAVRLTAYCAAASLFSGAALAVAQAWI